MGRGDLSVPSHTSAHFAYRVVQGVLAFFVFVFSVWISSSAVQAALSDPVEEGVTITASVASTEPPPVPILKRPRNNDVISDTRVEFRWEEVTGHLIPLDHYELVINGSTIFDDIPLTNYETDEYILTLEDGIYRLRLKQEAQLEDGEYTWKVRVEDDQNNRTSSTTWQFTIDTSAPSLIVTDVQGHQVSISASDPQTIPVDPLVVTVRQPYVYGSTEALAQVQLIVTRGDGSQQNFQMTATDDGHFLFTLPELDPQEIVYLSFTAIDRAGNTRALSGLKIQYRPHQLVIPFPDFFPNQPDIVIPLPEIPSILTPSGPVSPGEVPGEVPGEIPVQVTPGSQVFERPVLRYSWWRNLLIGLLLFYTFWIFLWTGNSWWMYPLWFGRFLLWIFLLPEGLDRFTTPSGAAVPWLPVTFEWIAAEGKFRRHRIWTSPSGNFAYPQEFTSIQTLTVDHPQWQWLPIQADRVLPAGYIGLGSETQSRVGGVSQKKATLVRPEDLVWSWARTRQARTWRWSFRLWPRLWLVGMLVVAVSLAWRAPIIESFLWLAATMWLVLRDVQGRLPSRWAGWSELERGS